MSWDDKRVPLSVSNQTEAAKVPKFIGSNEMLSLMWIIVDFVCRYYNPKKMILINLTPYQVLAMKVGWWRMVGCFYVVELFHYKQVSTELELLEWIHYFHMKRLFWI